MWIGLNSNSLSFLRALRVSVVDFLDWGSVESRVCYSQV